METWLSLLAVAAVAPAVDGSSTPFWSDPEVFWCSPPVVGPEDTITLSKRSSTLRELAVLRPGAETAHFLVVDVPPEEMLPLMSPDRLASSTEVRISVAELAGLEWREGTSSERVFTVAGAYQFWLSTALESEEGAYVCKVRYQPSRQLR